MRKIEHFFVYFVLAQHTFAAAAEPQCHTYALRTVARASYEMLECE